MVEVSQKKMCFGQESWAFGFPYKPKEIVLGFQHLFAFFGATVLIPLISGMDPSTALATGGIGTLIFHYLTKLKVPVFLGSSAGFVSGIVSTVARHGPLEGPQYACAGIMIAACISFALSIVIYFLGVARVQALFPPVVTGTLIIVIGVSLGYLAINDFFGLLPGDGEVNQFYNIHQWVSILIGVFTVAVVIFFMVFIKNFLSALPILIGMIVGFALCLILRACGLPTVDFTPIIEGKWINLPYGYYYLKSSNPVFGGIFTLPKWDWIAILSIAPLSLVTFMEHVGDITAISRVVGQDFFADPGLHRTMASDAIGSFVSGFLGGPEITTYSENTGVLASTKVYDPRILRLAALFSIILGFFGKFSGVIRSIPAPVKGGVSLILFGMIAACGVSSLIESRVDLSLSRNLIIVSLILSVGLGVNTATYGGGGTNGILLWFGNKTSFGLSGLFLCTIVGVVANLILPKKTAREKKKEAEMEEEEKANGLNETGIVGPGASAVLPVANIGDDNVSPLVVVNVNSPVSSQAGTPVQTSTPTSPGTNLETPITQTCIDHASEGPAFSVKVNAETEKESEKEIEIELEIE